MVPVASWVSVWSIRMPISPPATIRPATRWDSMSFPVRVLPISGILFLRGLQGRARLGIAKLQQYGI